MTQIQFRRDTASGWTSANPTLASGEVGFETNTLKFKFGDGSTAWTSLAYVQTTGATGAVPVQTFNNQTASYTLVLGDASNIVTVNSSSATTLTVPPHSSVAFPTATRIDLVQLGSGQVTIAPGSGVTISATPGLKLASQNSSASLLNLSGSDTWLLVGSLSA